MSRAVRGWIPFVIAMLLIVGIPGVLVIGVLWYQRSGVLETALQPQVARLSGDSHTISVGVTWLEEGWCLGEFQAGASEGPSEVRLAMTHRQFTHGGVCAGVGTIYNTAWADVVLNAPLGNRTVVRSSDGAQLPVLAQDERFLRRHPVGADIQQFGGLNDSPRLGLRNEAHITDVDALTKLATQLDSLPPFPEGGISCPNDDASYYLVELDYTVAGNTSLKIKARGCNDVYVNGLGKAAAWALPGSVNVFSLLNSLLAA